MYEQIERIPNSVGFWRRNRIAGLEAEPRWYCPPRDPEEKERWEQESNELAGLKAFESRVQARYRQMKEHKKSTTAIVPNEDLAKLILKGIDQHPKDERTALAMIEQRAASYDDAHLEAKGPQLAALPKHACTAERLAVLREHNIRIVMPAISQKWAQVDGRDFCLVRSRFDQISAAITIAHVARVNSDYANTLAVEFPQVLKRVHELDSENSALIMAKEVRKSVDTIAATFCGGSIALHPVKPVLLAEDEHKSFCQSHCQIDDDDEHVHGNKLR